MLQLVLSITVSNYIQAFFIFLYL